MEAMSSTSSSSAVPAAIAALPEKRICAGCLGQFRIVRGVMVRHGFQAKNVRHGQSTGFHTGRCGGVGVMPIGTAGGNGFASRLAEAQIGMAARLEALPEVSTEAAVQDAIHEARDSLFRRRPASAEERALYSTPESFANTSVRGWFSPGSIEQRRRFMGQRRAEEIAQRRQFAADLRAAVVANPVEG